GLYLRMSRNRPSYLLDVPGSIQMFCTIRIVTRPVRSSLQVSRSRLSACNLPQQCPPTHRSRALQKLTLVHRRPPCTKSEPTASSIANCSSRVVNQTRVPPATRYVAVALHRTKSHTPH